MTEDNNRDRPQDEGQEGIDRETERRNRENETGQAQNQQFGQDRAQPPTDQDKDSSAFGQQGQSAGGDTTLSERTGQTSGGSASGEAGSEGFVGSGNDDSSDYLTKGEENQDFAARGESAQDTDAGRSDIETGQPQDEPSDDSPDSNR